jgi:hypothetical protein
MPRFFGWATETKLVAIAPTMHRQLAFRWCMMP